MLYYILKEMVMKGPDHSTQNQIFKSLEFLFGQIVKF